MSQSSEEQVDSITLATERLSVDAERDTSVKYPTGPSYHRI